MANLKLATEKLFVVNVYAPTDCRLQTFFLQKLTYLLVSKTCISKVIMAGDWNTTLSHLDKTGGLPWRETLYRNGLLSLMKEFNLVEVYRRLHPNSKTYTNETKNKKLKSRIDFFIITKQLINQVKKIERRTSIAPDHKAVFLSIEIDQAPARGPGNWKFNNTLLKDNEYINLIKNNFPSFQEKYQNVESRQLYWELLKMEIRSTTIAYSKQKKFNLRNRETIIQRKLEELDTEICNNQNFDGDILMEYENLKNELTEIYAIKGKEAMFRSRTRWIENGEKPTKYFFNLEKRNYEKKIITQLKTTDGEIISDMTKINKEIENYYKNFLTTKVSQEKINDYDDHFASFTSNLQNPKLCEVEVNELEHDLTKDELLNALKGFQPGKTPGDDGFTKEFYETFFELLWGNLIDSFNEAFQTGKLSISQRRGIISLIPKDENNLMVLSNWRPITLLNVDYKILARAIAKRIESKLPKLVHSDQTGFVKGRYIGQNVRLLNDLMEFTELNKLPGILLFIDFEKAFDTLEWPFIHHALKFLNFGPNICKWISVLYNEVESGVINGGYMTNYFQVTRGVRQGCPLSPLLLILCVEILAQKFVKILKLRVLNYPILVKLN